MPARKKKKSRPGSGKKSKAGGNALTKKFSSVLHSVKSKWKKFNTSFKYKFYYPGSKMYNAVQALKYFFRKYKKHFLISGLILLLLLCIILLFKACGGSDFAPREEQLFSNIYNEPYNKQNFKDLQQLYQEYDKEDKKKVADDLARYQRRIIKYPEEPENYKELSDLFEKIGDTRNSEKFYDLYQQAKKLQEEKDDDERARKWRDLINKLKQNSPSPPPGTEGISDDVKQDKKSEGIDLKEIEKTSDPNEKKAKQLYNDGVKAHNDKNYKQAVDKFKQAIKIKDNFQPAYSHAGYSFLADDRIQDARQYADQALDLDDSDDRAAFTLGEVYRKLQDDEKAEQFYRKAIANNDNHLLAYFRLANLKFKRARKDIHQKANLDESRKLYNQCLKIDPGFYKAALNLGITYMFQNNNPQAAIKVFKKVLNNDKLSGHKKSYFIVNKSIGQCYYKLKNYTQSAKYLRKALSIIPHAKTYFALGLACEKMDKLGTAKKNYKKAINKKDNYAEAKFNLGNLYFREKRYEEALTLFNKTISDDSGFIEAYVNAGKCKTALNQIDAAKKYFDKAISKAPHNPTANIELAKYWKHKYSLDKAVKHAKIALQHENNEDDKIIYYNELGLIYLKFEIYDEAQRYLKIAKKINPSSENTLENLGNVYIKRKMFKEARVIYENMIKINKNNYDAYYMLAGVYDKLDNVEAAKNSYKKLLQIKPDYPKKAEINKYLSSH
ncbi:MAG TPA: tetratricopeptide repeat protein [Spirochaetota bacterium]|nr:tetratricopeptide repeat protein [Spirochaetota bacterium]